MIEALPMDVEVAISEAFGKGGDGAVELANKVVAQCDKESSFTPLYSVEDSLESKLSTIAEVGYGGSIVMSYKAQQQLTALKKHGFDNMAVCFAKTPMSITTDGSVKGAPKGFDVPIRELKLCAGAGFIYALSGSVMTMPGLPDKPAFMNLDIDEDGNIVGLS
jgi:formate--tetrahydrofolate ligase